MNTRGNQFDVSLTPIFRYLQIPAQPLKEMKNTIVAPSSGLTTKTGAPVGKVGSAHAAKVGDAPAAKVGGAPAAKVGGAPAAMVGSAPAVKVVSEVTAKRSTKTSSGAGSPSVQGGPAAPSFGVRTVR